MKIQDILAADFRDKEIRKEIITKFKSIDAVKDRLENLESDKAIFNICEEIMKENRFDHGVVFYHIENQTCILFDKKSKQDFTFYSQDMKELFIKMATFAYYYRRKKEKK